jgi:hypothetical protein
VVFNRVEGPDSLVHVGDHFGQALSLVGSLSLHFVVFFSRVFYKIEGVFVNGNPF